MNLWRLSALTAFGAVTGLCVNYAHSQSQQTKIWKSSAWLGSCSLKAFSVEGQTWEFQPAGFSRTRFQAGWPTDAGELWLTTGSKAKPWEPLVGGEPVDPDETLLIKFSKIAGKIEPVSYVYDNVKLRKETKGTIQPKVCALQKR